MQLIVQVRIAKLLLLATTFRCIRPVLDISACLSHRTPFAAPFDMMGELNAARDSFSTPAGIAPRIFNLRSPRRCLCYHTHFQLLTHCTPPPHSPVPYPFLSLAVRRSQRPHAHRSSDARLAGNQSAGPQGRDAVVQVCLPRFFQPNHFSLPPCHLPPFHVRCFCFLPPFSCGNSSKFLSSTALHTIDDLAADYKVAMLLHRDAAIMQDTNVTPRRTYWLTRAFCPLRCPAPHSTASRSATQHIPQTPRPKHLQHTYH